MMDGVFVTINDEGLLIEVQWEIDLPGGPIHYAVWYFNDSLEPHAWEI